MAINTQLLGDPDTAKYDVIVDQSSTSPNQKEATWAVLSQMGPMLKDVMTGPVLMKLLEYSPLPESLMEEIKQITMDAAQQQKPDPEEQKMQAEMQMEQEKIKAQMQMAQAKMQMDQQSKQADLQMQREKHMMEMEARKMDIQLERVKFGAKMEFDAAEAQQSMEIKRGEAQTDAEIARYKAETTAQSQAYVAAQRSRQMDRDAD